MTVTRNPAIGRAILAGDILTNYFEEGTGSPVVLLHGSGVGVSAFANWNRTLPEIGRNFRAIALDVAGFGYSAPPVNAVYGLDYWVKHVVSFLDALKIDQTNLIGNSFGGALALALTSRHPERVARVMLMGSVGTEFTVPPAFGSGFSGELTRETMRSVLQNFTFDPSRITDEMVDLRLTTAARPESQARQSRLFPGPREERVAALITPPETIAAIANQFLIMHGQDDKIVPVETSQRLHSLIKRSDMYVFGECGHWSHIDRAREFNAMATQFFKH